MSEKKPLLGYVEQQPPGWQEAVECWPWVAENSADGAVLGWHKRGDCPRCGGGTVIVLGLIRTDAVQSADVVYAACGCAAAHEAGKTGCGSAAMIHGPQGG